MNEFKASTLTIGWRAQVMSETLLVRISGKRVYKDLEFEEDQREHRAAVQQKLVSLHHDVVAIMTNSYEVFKNDGPEVGGPVARAVWVGRSSAPPVPSDPSLGLSPPPQPPRASQTSCSSLGFAQPSAFQTSFLQDSASRLSVEPARSLPVGWFSFPRTCLVFPEGLSSPCPSHQIQQQWLQYTIRLDRMMEDALRLNVKWSLLELSKAINGDGKTTPNPLFQVLVILKNDMQGGVAQVGTTLPPTARNHHTLFASFRQSLNLALGPDFLLQPPGLVLRCPAFPVLSLCPPGPVLSRLHCAPAGGVLTHSADLGKCGQ